MFQGTSALALGAKGRMPIPSRHREALQLQAGDRVTMTERPDGHLMLFPRPEWERFRERIAAFPMEARWWKRILLGSAADVELDTAGRILVTPELHTAVSLGRDVMLLGMDNYFEVWDAAAYAVKRQAVTVQGMPDTLKDFFSW